MVILHYELRQIFEACHEKDILEIAIIARADYRVEEINFRNNDYRKAVYYQLCL